MAAAAVASNRFERRKQASRAQILDAALELFRAQGMERTTIDEICERADVAQRTFFNHFPRREDMVRALAHARLTGLADLLAERRVDARPVPDLLVGLFDDVAAFLEGSGPFYRELVGTMLALTYRSTDSADDESAALFGAFLELVEDGVARGEVAARHDPSVLTEIVVGTLVSVLMGWTADDTYPLRSRLHDAAAALGDLLTLP